MISKILIYLRLIKQLMSEFIIYTDGSCNTEYKLGAWAAIILFDSEELVLQGIETDTTHNRMELLSVIRSFEYIIKNKLLDKSIRVFTDSQYVAGIEGRTENFKLSDFKTKSGKDIQNIDLVKKLIKQIEMLKPKFIKVKAHQKKTSERNINREVDKLSRKLVRDYLKKAK